MGNIRPANTDGTVPQYKAPVLEFDTGPSSDASAPVKDEHPRAYNSLYTCQAI